MIPFLLLALYIVTGTFGLRLSAEAGFAAPVWYPSGIALAFLILYGFRLVPAVWIAAAAVNILNGASVTMALLIAVGNTLEPVCGAWVLRRFTPSHQHFDSPTQVMRLVLLGALLAPLLSAGNGAFALWLHGHVDYAHLLHVAKTWWLGDMLGILLVTPLILAWSQPFLRFTETVSWQEITLLIGALLATSVLFSLPMLHDIFPVKVYPYLIYPLVLWVALRFEAHGVSLVIFLLSLFSLWSVMRGYGPFAHDNRLLASTNVQLFFGVAAITTLLMASVVRQRRAVAEHLREAAEMNSLLAAIVASSDDAIVGKSLDGRITSWNQGAEALYGYSAHEALGKPVTMLLPLDRQEEITGILERIQQGERIEQYETIRQRKNGSLINISLTVSPIRNQEGLITGASAIARDITRRKRLEAMKETFLSMISHELRTPLASVKANLDNLRVGVGGTLNEKQQLLVDIAGRNIDRLARIISNILDFSRLESGRALLNLRSVNVPHLITELRQSLEPTLQQHRLQVSFTAPDHFPQIVADPDLFQQVLFNLLDNAIRFAQSSIQIHCQREYHTVTIIVSDDGIGIPQEKIPLLFNRFQQINRPVGEGYKGTGLGLVICKEILNLHGGMIWVESPPGMGCRFYCRLPIQGPPKREVS